METYPYFNSRSTAILACAITALIQRSPELALHNRDIKQVLYRLAQQDWRDHQIADRQADLASKRLTRKHNSSNERGRR